MTRLNWLGPVLHECVRVVQGALESGPKTTRLAFLILVGGGVTALVLAATSIR
ncbi:hypothetical protein Q8791_23540 [Nocardiopsis sp. CT-R113]|uniref:Uncharacterized protein n=1 Tax=Nocardiopsis codii TaxID=3065942 RepID=A0ABU7KD84_9ACTN|nr:hypothetical protein [Nocardiopsis sp. CT-R113]MEE2040195.1 hypothetical protein [Nocardiopsis sp. CT-R113]